MNNQAEIEHNESRCINCGACYKACPMMNSFSISPKGLLDNMSHDKAFAQDVAYACMLCNACTEVCPKQIDLKAMCQHIRNDNYQLKQQQSKTVRLSGIKTVKNYQRSSFSKVFSSNKKYNNIKRVFIPGCSLASYSPSIIKNIMQYLRVHFEDVDLLVRCCAKPSRDIGDIESFHNQIQKTKKLIEDHGIEEVIVACENCYTSYKSNLKGVKVTSLYEVIDELGIPKHLMNHYQSNKIYALHDPCKIKDEEAIHISVRNILKDLGITIKEFPRNRDKTACCGSGGMVRETNRKIWEKQAMRRAAATDAPHIISYCQSCVDTLSIGGKKTFHIIDFLFNEQVIQYEIEQQKKNNFLKSWTNKYISAHHIK